MHIIPMRDLKNTVEVERLCAEENGPVFVTKNGYGRLVVMDIDYYEKKKNATSFLRLHFIYFSFIFLKYIFEFFYCIFYAHNITCITQIITELHITFNNIFIVYIHNL